MQTESQKSLIDLLPVVLPLLKAAQQQQQPQKGWGDDLARIITVIAPLLKSAGGQQQDKSFLDDALRIVTVIGPLLKGGGAAAQPQKGFLDDALNVIAVLGPLLKSGGSQKGFFDDLSPWMPSPFNPFPGRFKVADGQDKNVFGDILRVVATVGPFLL